MRYLIVVMLLIASAGCMTTGVPAEAEPPDPFVLVSSDELAERIESAPVEGNLSFDAIVNAGEHSALVVHRNATGQAEYHEYDTDFWVVREGEGLVVYGGEIVEPETVGPGEIRGSAIRGGSKRVVRAGDIVNIPPKMNHHLILESGREITYLIVKIRER